MSGYHKEAPLQRPNWADALLVLESGVALWGRRCGAHGHAVGELCFNTALTGYQEVISDPSYADQIITFTTPHIGNVGVNDLDREHPRAACKGVVLREAPTVPANYRAERSLEEWLTEQGVIGIYGVDTRALTSILREGAQRAMVMSIDQDEPSLDLDALLAEVRAWEGLEGAELSLKVTGEKRLLSGERTDDERAWPVWSGGDWVAPESAQASPDHARDDTGGDIADQPLVLVVDFGAKDNIMRCLVDAGCRVELVNPESDVAELLARNPDGVCLSNGPGDPAATLEYARPLIEGLLARPELPIFGICLGHQVLALTLGARTAKMIRGHRGANHPILNLETARVEITSQNHGFVVTDLPEGVIETHRSLFDGTIAGLKLEGRPVSSVQYHPEASPGPHDSRYLFAAFAAQARAHQAHAHRINAERDTSLELITELAAQIESARPALVHASRLEIKPRRIMIVGAGPIVIGQACEFDYSGAQACKSLRSSGHEVILVNSNPATIMTDPQLANRTYIEPLTVAYLTEVIRVERPDALLPTMGGQTALNVCLELAEKGVLDEFNVEMIGARAESIETAEDRLLFREAMDEIGLASPISRLVTDVEMAVEASEYTGFPAIIRPSFTLGGSGGGIAEDLDELREIVARGIKLSPVGSVLIEESLLGWKEYELEVVRDRADNGIIICSIENIDPMGIHTGDSITVAPSLTLTDKEQQRLRDQAINCLRRVGVDTGGSNVQFSVNPKTGRAVVIEMNPRVSRSSALASKATGFPIAKVAAQLAVGHTLDELQNEITRVTPASFEPSIDYVVVKIPRFTFEKFSDDVPELNTSMKSVGEVMALGRSFSETLQKALRGLEVGYSGLDDQPFPNERADQLALLEQRIPYRLLLVAQGLRAGLSVDDLAQHTGIDPWYIRELEAVVGLEAQVKAQAKAQTKAQGEGLESIDARMMLQLKRSGLSDKRLATLLSDVSERNVSEREVRARRWALGVHPNYRRVDTCAAEFESHTQYLYSSYELNDEAVTTIEGDSAEASELASTLRSSCEAQPSERKKVIILGGGPNRIGQGIEFDYCCVHAAYAIRDAGYESIMVNCNPETVSTDYDTADRLYFEPLSAEDVIEVARVEASRGELLGVIVQLGGQTPLNLAEELEYAGIPILGTPRDVIDRAEDRARFQALIEGLELRQPKSEVADDVEHAARIATEVGYPVLLRPSYVLGGRAMRVVEDEAGLREYIDEARKVSVGGGVLIDQYLTNAIEVDVDALCDGSDVWVVGVMEHIEEAGVHSGDSACSLPPYSLSDEVIAEIKRQAEAIALELGVVGLMNIQFAVSADEVYLIEVNPRASRTVPFVAKTYNIPVARIATQLMLGSRLSELELPEPRAGYIAVKEAVFPFARFPNADLILGPEMLSTGEVMGWDRDFGLAYAKAQIAAGMNLPESGGVLFTIGDERLRSEFAPLAAQAHALGYTIYVTPQTHEAWSEIESQAVTQTTQTPRVVCEAHKADELFKSGKIQLLISVDHPHTSTAEAAQVRRAALATGVPYFTRLTNTRALIQALKALAQRERPSVHALQD